MKYYWVSQGKTFQQEYKKGIIWAPQSKTWHHEIVKEAQNGDIILSYYKKKIIALGLITSNPYPSNKPFNEGTWSESGWQADIKYLKLEKPIDDI